jgi:flavin reductase (DIM6/NTAB) family NADH-FMN oxidoreductase RutF
MQKKAEYSEAIGTKYPEQVVIAIAKDKAGKANPVTLGWTMIVSGNPPMMAIAVAKKHYSIEAINHSKCFTISFPSSDMADAALFFGSKSGRDTDKFADPGNRFIASGRRRCQFRMHSRIKDACW